MEMNYQMGSIIKMKRMELNMSQEQLAEGICASSYLSRIENNKLIPGKFSSHIFFLVK